MNTPTSPELKFAISVLHYAEQQAMRTRCVADLRAAAQRANECASLAEYADRETYWRRADQWSAMADQASR